MNNKNVISIQGIVSIRDKQPYVQLFKGENIICQLTMSEARQIAHNILLLAARTEADAMIHKFFDKAQFPVGASQAIMFEFRDFRARLDEAKPEHEENVPLIIKSPFTN